MSKVFGFDRYKIANFPDNLYHYRFKAGFTQEELAYRVGINLQHISKYERGVNLPSLKNLIRISGALEITIEELLARNPELDKPSPEELF